MDLPTTPIGKQQMIDLRAGAILRQNSRKNGQYLGCPVGLLLVLALVIKSVLISVWVIREYGQFDFTCSSGTVSKGLVTRTKRWTPFANSQESLDPRTFAKDVDEDGNVKSEDAIISKAKKRPVLGGSRRGVHISDMAGLGAVDPEDDDDDIDEFALSTVVTMTNTQLIPLKGAEHGTVKMKTIRNRLEKVGSEEEQFIEIDIADAPKIYVSKIKSRNGDDTGSPATDLDLLGDVVADDKKKRRKGKGKKAKRLEEERKRKGSVESTTSADVVHKSNDLLTTNPATGNKQRKEQRKNNRGGGNKRKKQGFGEPTTEVTKSPRHLFTGAGSNAPTTARPHQSRWIDGAVDAQDERFSNRGAIRGFPMQTASKRPDPPRPDAPRPTELKISDTTRLMWQMDELNFTTFLSPRTTQTTIAVDDDDGFQMPARPTSAATISSVVAHPTQPTSSSLADNETRQRPTAAQPTVEETTHDSFSLGHHGRGQEAPSATGRPTADVVETTTTTARVWLPPRSFNADADSNADMPYDVDVNEERSRYEKEFPTALRPIGRFGSGTDASFVDDVDDGDTTRVLVKDLTPEAKPTIRPDPQHFQMELSKFTTSAICYARSAFNVWCCASLLSAGPFLIGICSPRWSLFIVHVVCDVAALVVGFIVSFTLAVLTLIVYFMVDEMGSETLFQFLFVSLLIDVALFVYALVIVVSFRCCSRLINARKDDNDNYVIDGVEQV